MFSPATVGFYTRAVSLKDMVTTYSSSSLTKVFYPVLSSLQHDHVQFSRVYFKVISVIAFLSFGLTGVLYVLGADIIILLFGAKWAPSIQIFQILILSVCNYPLNSMMVNAFMSKGKSRENFAIGILRKFVRVIPLLFAFFYGIYEFTVAAVIVSYFLTVLNVLFLRKFAQLELTKHFIKIFEGLAPLIILIVTFQLVDFSTIELRLLLVFGFLVFYLSFNWFIKAEGLIFIWQSGLNMRKIFL